MPISKEFKAHAKLHDQNPEELLAFYRGLGPAPAKIERMAGMVAKVGTKQKPTAKTKTDEGNDDQTIATRPPGADPVPSSKK